MSGLERALDFSMKKKTTEVVKFERPGSPSGSDGSSQSPSSTTPGGAVGHSLGAFNIFSAAATQGVPPNLAALLGNSAPPGFQPFPKKTLCPTPPFFGPGALGETPFSPPGVPWMPPSLSAAASLSPTSGSPNIFQSIPDPAFFPTASLALSTLHRRRRAMAIGSHLASVSSSQTAADHVTKVENPAARNSAEEPEAKRPAKCVPDDEKDEQYWERRRKNNEAAKRSRDTRRAKEEEIAMRAALLEQENLKLRAQVAVLKNETAKLNFMLFSQVQQNAAGVGRESAPSGSTSNSNHSLSHGHHIFA